MTDTVVFVANGFIRENVRLQPWRYVYELAKFRSRDCRVIIITEGNSHLNAEDWDEGFSVVQTQLLSIRRQSELGAYIQTLAPSELWWSTTPRSIAFFPVLSKIDCHKIAFITCPLYRWMELIRASLSRVPYEQTRALWQQRLLPRWLFRYFLNSNAVNHVVVQSKNNHQILNRSGVSLDKLSLLPVGIDDKDVQSVDSAILGQVEKSLNKNENDIVFLFLGALRPIRGFDALIKVYPDVVNNNPNARLVVLARGASDEQCESYLNQLKSDEVKSRVSFISGWLSREQVWSYIELSDIVVLPFLLVPSDIPIAVLESLARGKPVVVSPVDGLPELGHGRGVIVDPMNTRKFSEELIKLSEDDLRISEYTKAAKEFIKQYPRWSDVGELMLDVSYRLKRNK